MEINQLDFQKTVKIPIIAKLPEFKLEIIENINFGACSVYDNVLSTIKINNLSELNTFFEIDIQEPFSVSPINGEIKPKSSVDITLLFEPKV